MGIEIGILFAFLAMICWGFGDFLIQKSTRKIGNIESLFFIGIIGSIFLLPLVIHDFNNIFSTSNLILLGMLSLLVFISAVFNFESLRQGKISVVEVILELELPITIFLGFVFFKETLSFLQLMLISFIFIGIILIATKSFKHFSNKFEKGVFYSIIAAILMGAVNFLTASSSRQISPIVAVWFPWFIFSILCFFIIYRKGNLTRMYKNSLKFKTVIFAMGILDTLAWIFYAQSVFKNDVSIITAITESYPVIGLVLGVIINKEKIRVHQYFGAAIALIASIILAISV